VFCYKKEYSAHFKYGFGEYKLKVVVVNNGMPHYYNYVLSRLNRVPGIELLLVVPAGTGRNIEEGVYQTKEGVNFRVCELKEFSLFNIYRSFRGLAKLLAEEKPSAVFLSELYLFGFMFNIPVLLVMKTFGIKLILRSIPFRLLSYNDARIQIKNWPSGGDASRGPWWLNTLLLRTVVIKLLRRIVLEGRRIAFNMADAHVCYVDEAVDLYGTYGVPKEKIFVARNSPDTDMLLNIRESLKSVAPILPACDHRLIHAGRLVDWKRVDLLLKAFARVRRQFNDAELITIGSGPREEELKALSAKLGIERDVRFLGAIHDPRLLGQYLLSASIYVLAGMGGLSINDAMCFGLPIICSVCDGTEKKLVRDGVNGKYFMEGNEDDLVAKIVYIFNNPDLRRQMGMNSTEIIRNEINIHTVIAGYLDALQFTQGSK